MRKPARIAYLLIGVTISSVIGCTSNVGYFQSTLDQTSGVTIASLPEPMTLARAAPRLSTSARDYLYLGPVEINRMGTKELYLWLGLASTVDRRPLGEAPLLPTELLIVADGSPMRLSLEDWNPGTMGATPYKVGATLYKSLQARVAAHQLRLLAEASTLRVYLRSEQVVAARYRHWSGSVQHWAQSSGTIETAERR